MKRFLILSVGTAFLAAAAMGCGGNAKDKDKNSGLDRPKSAGKDEPK